jgi:hypothetical protein
MEFEKYIGSEAEFQAAVAKYLDYCNVQWCHVANERNTTKLRGAMLKAQGVKSGVPDILIFEPRGKNIGLAIELKVGHNKPTRNQREWLVNLSLRGWKCIWSNSIEEVIETIDNYLYQQILKN